MGMLSSCPSITLPASLSLSLSLSLQPLFKALARCIPCALRGLLALSLSLSFFLSLALSVSTSPALSVSTSPALSVSLSVSTHGNMCARFYGKKYFHLDKKIVFYSFPDAVRLCFSSLSSPALLVLLWRLASRKPSKPRKARKPRKPGQPSKTSKPRKSSKQFGFYSREGV